MDDFKEGMNYLKGYQHVADFQRFCGVEIVEVDDLDEDKANVANGHCNSEEKNVENGTQNNVKHRSVKSHTNGFKNGITNPNEKESKLAYKINNKFLFYLLQFGASLGSEMFYIVFYPFMTWNVDSRMTRQILLIWYPLMYFGQFLKDWIQWPRPGPPAVRLEGNRFEMEYGMPSTHTIVGTCIPFSLLFLTSKYYEYPFILGLLAAITWAGLVAASRVYLGMHTAFDCIAGISLTAIALPWMLSVVEYVEYYQVTSPYAPFVSFLIPLLACIYYPKPKVWSITRGDTSNIVSIGACCIFSTWLNYHLGWMKETPKPTVLQPLPSITAEWVTYSLIRTVLGVVALAVSRIITKKIFLKLVCFCAGVDTKDITKQRELGLEVPVRWLTIGGLAVSTVFTAPICFSYLGINRENYYSEVGL
ncbi:sphingosine-1-phosphate phosphatase 2-like [Mercenaria mercenaria]|uniref:sphingosine-1-phosphate phosphatase 2-like n=1 Tax=Mercenaria mercenaria TaxID=6596 RepID=UPI00234F4993|nr:sphingosine-1-phosphate phosphatase 2-like [Mercenaria mercenaria]